MTLSMLRHCLWGLLALFPATSIAAASAPPSHGMAMHGSTKYPANFTHFDYANPLAPKGGSVRLAAIGTAFDTLHPYILKGNPAVGIDSLYETLMAPANDEAFSSYGLIAESVEMPEDRSWVIFNLRPEARWHDGKPISADDVLFSFNTLKSLGRPFYRFYYQTVTGAEKLNEHRVRFTFNAGENRELPLIMGQLPILPRHYWKDRDFSKTSLDIPLGSGPYRVDTFEPGRFIRYARVKDYWGENLPVRRGQNNFDLIRYDYYRDATVAMEAFKAGEYDWRFENVSKFWATGYNEEQIKDGLVVKEEIGNERPTGMQGFVYNLRRPLFQDIRVREALAFAFDYEWTNKNLFYGQYTRTESYFSNSELASRGIPTGEELALLAPFRGQLPKELFTRAYHPPATDGSGRIRHNLRQAAALLKAAGWMVKNGKLVDANGAPFSFEILLNSPVWERIALPFIKNLKRLGIEAQVRVVDSAQYQERTETFDYDMLVDVFGQSLSPGNEQRDYWTSAAASRNGARNTIGIKNPVIDALVEQIISAPDRDSLIARTRALDRVLLWGQYVIPHWHIQSFRLAYWNKFSKPEISPKYDLGFESWWFDQDKAKQLSIKQGRKHN